MEVDIDWLYSKDCDLNEMEENILSAFNIDVRRSAVESTAITIYHNKKDYICVNGIFQIEVDYLVATEEKPICFG